MYGMQQKYIVEINEGNESKPGCSSDVNKSCGRIAEKSKEEYPGSSSSEGSKGKYSCYNSSEESKGKYLYDSSSEGSKEMYSCGRQSDKENNAESGGDRSNWRGRKFSYGYGDQEGPGEPESRYSYSGESGSRSPYSNDMNSRTPYSSDPEEWQGNPSGEAYRSRLANLSIAASIAGFLSMLIPYLTLPLGIMALLFGILSLIRNEYSRGRAVTGIVLGSCLILIGGTLIICVSALSPYADDLTRIFMEYMQHMQPVR